MTKPTPTIRPPDVYVADTAMEKGQGVFAGRDFQPGEIVEIAPALVSPHGFNIFPKNLRDRFFGWPDRFGRGTPCFAFVLGYGSIYNHGNPANMSYSPDLKNETMTFIAARGISKDEELTINYNARDRGPISDDDRWFRTHKVKPVASS